MFPKWLDVCLDNGISEQDFWNLTIGEIGRLIESRTRVAKREAQEKASYDYILADLVGRSIGRIYNTNNHYPQIYEVYPTLFDNKQINEKQQEQIDNLSALRFKQFANSFNSRIKEGAKDK